MNVILVKHNCMVCGKQGEFTTNEQGSKDITWIEQMVTTQCCYKDEVAELNEYLNMPVGE